MGFFKRNWRELLVAGIFVALIIGLAIAAPYLLPAFFAATLKLLIPAAAAITSAIGMTITPAAIFYGAAAIGALIFGTISGFFTRAVRICCSSSSPDALSASGSDSAITPDAQNASGLQLTSTPSYGAGQQPSFLATQFGAAPQAEQVLFVASADPLKTPRGELTPGYLQTTTGEFRGRVWMTQYDEFQPEPTQQTNPFVAANTAPGATETLKPIYTETYRPGY